MGRSQQTFNKSEREKKRLKKREEKLKRKEERKNNAVSGLDNMMAYVDEHGNITDTPPDETKKEKIKAEDIEIGVPKREESEEDTIKRGKVAFFNDSKGFGFIKDKDSPEQYFVHVNGVLEPISENDNVTFELERGPKGMIAVNVKKV